MMDMETLSRMDYWEIRSAVARVVPRSTVLIHERKKVSAVREKGRKRNYEQYSLRNQEWRKQERLLNTEEINSFLEISLRAQACPMPFNLDIWDGLLCPFNCIYCYANAFRASLYTAFFDNSRSMGFRHCNPTYYKQELDKMAALRDKPFDEKVQLSGIYKAFALQMPVRMGIRFEDFLRSEAREKISLEMLNYLADIEYPVMINTKSDLVGRDDYVEALARNVAGGAVHVTAITSDEDITRRLEPGAPSFEKRMEGIRNMVAGGVRVVARIEPYLFLLTDNPEDVQYYMDQMWAAGVRNITFDTYSYTALNPGIRQSFINAGYDFDRIFLAGCDSQPLGSLLLGKFMDIFRAYGFSCSTFDMGNVPSNDQAICCEVGDYFEARGGRFNWGSTVMAARFIKERPLQPVSWSMFRDEVYRQGGFLTADLERSVHELWNLGGNVAYSHRWAEGLTPAGRDEHGIIWIYDTRGGDFRMKLLEELA